MIERDLSAEERREIEALIRTSGLDLSEVLFMLFSSAGGALVVGFLIFLLAGAATRLADFAVGIDSWWVSDFPRLIGFGLGALFVLLNAIQLQLELRKTRIRRAALRADLEAGLIEEEEVGLAHVWRVREEEHATELLLLQADDGRLCALIDESTTASEGRGPRRSALRLAERMYVVRYPVSGTVAVRFSGSTIRRPPLLSSTSRPQTWPDREGWQNESAETILSRIAPQTA